MVLDRHWWRVDSDRPALVPGSLQCPIRHSAEGHGARPALDQAAASLSEATQGFRDVAREAHALVALLDIVREPPDASVVEDGACVPERDGRDERRVRYRVVDTSFTTITRLQTLPETE